MKKEIYLTFIFTQLVDIQAGFLKSVYEQFSEIFETSSNLLTMVLTPDKQSTKPPPLESIASPNFKGRKKLTIWVAGVAAIACVGLASVYVITQKETPKVTPVPTPSVAEQTKVTALGRLEPQGEVIKLSVANAQDSRVDKLLVSEGDKVKAGQVIAILQGMDKKQAALAEAKQYLTVQRAKLTQLKAGEAKAAEIAAQEANIARIEAQLRTQTAEKQAAIARAQAELRNAEIDYQRYESLHKEGAIETYKRDERRKSWETAQATLSEANAQLANTVSTLQKQIRQEKAMLEKLWEVRPVDLEVAQAEVDYAATQVTKAQAELNDNYVRVPVAGQILKINTRVGEQVNTSQGIVELGRTQQMYAVAEVYETDVGKLQVGQRASIVSEHGGFAGTLHGKVEHIGLQIKKQDVLASDPAADKDARVVEVKVRLDPQDTPKVAGLTNLQVRITFDLDSKYVGINKAN
ncbi:ABC exporter membrane fusion protein [Chlorogloeopsis fritschii]|uniref:ABC exporter membrane fusion protein n=1 Tax=Chlorogloeopsis fritschii TaxID=1124 RepID=UPI0023F33372|nr:ABC exporter membrane fusion protein [Chlorogloeopsis fritschii]